MSIYSIFIRPLAFALDPETAHHLAIAAGAGLGGAAGVARVDDERLATDVAGLRFLNPIGLAAGFDKSGSSIRALAGPRLRLDRDRFDLHRSIRRQPKAAAKALA
jgi:dihydroorotate dehydrogenase (fumarate)/dihydroorotate dehydrogenase